MAEFDLEGALAAGWSAQEIVDYLAKDYPDFDVSAAREAKHSDEDIARFLATGTEYDRTPGGAIAGPAATVGRGINTGLSSVLGFPGDSVRPAIDHASETLGVGAPGESPALFPWSLLQALQLIPTSGDVRQGFNTAGNLMQSAVGAEPSNITYENLTDLPPSQRPFAVGGEVIGQSAPIAAAPLAVAQSGVKTGVSFIDDIIQSAGRSPAAFAGAETAATTGAATGGAAAEALMPGDEIARMVGEVGGAFVHPISAFTRSGISSGVRNLIGRFTTLGKEQRAASYLADLFTKNGEDPAEILTALQQAKELGMQGTVAQQTNSPTVVALENYLSGRSKEFGTKVAEDAIAATNSLEDAIGILRSTGNPEDLATAVKARGAQFDIFAKEVLGRAEQEAQTSLDKLRRGGDPAMVSREAHATLEKALDASNLMVRNAWEQVPDSTEAFAINFMRKNSEIRSRMLPTERLPSKIEGMVKSLGSNWITDTRTMNNLRSSLLNEARVARKAHNYRDAGIYEELASGALDDLMRVQGPEAQEARDLTRRFHETFTNTFANLGLRDPSPGGATLHPEAMLDRAFGTGGVPNKVQVDALRAATEFPTGGEELVSDMSGSLMNFARGRAATRGTDPLSGEARPRTLADMADQPVMQDMPDVAQEMREAGSAQSLLDLVRNQPQRASAAVDRMSPFGQILRGTDPVEAVTIALRQDMRRFNTLANTATRSGPNAVSALKSATLESVMRSAGVGSGDTNSFAKMRRAFLTPKTEGQPSLLDNMVSRGIMDEEEAERLTQLLNRGTKLHKAVRNRANLDEAVAPADAVTDLLTRLVGVSIGTRAGKATGGHTMVAAGAGSRAATKMLNRAPTDSIMRTLEAMVRDPELFASAVQRMPDRAPVHRQINAALVQAGLDPLFEDDE